MDGVFVRGRHVSRPKNRGCAPILGNSYLCPNPLTENDQIRRGNTGERCFYWCSVSHAIEYCTNALRGLSAIAEFLAFNFLVCRYNKFDKFRMFTDTEQ